MSITIDMPGTVRLGAVFGTAFNVFRRHVVAFIVVSVIAHIPGYLWFSWVVVNYARAGALPPPWAGLVVSVVDLMCVMIAYGAIIYAVMQDLAGRLVALAKAVTLAAGPVSPLAGVSVVVLALIESASWLVLPASLTEEAAFEAAHAVNMLVKVLVMAMYFVVAPVFIAEQAGVGAALSRVRFLTKGRRWQIFGAILLVGILDLAIAIIVEAVAAPAVAALGQWGPSLGMLTTDHGISLVLGTFNAVMAAVFYDRLRSAKDGVHLVKVFD